MCRASKQIEPIMSHKDKSFVSFYIDSASQGKINRSKNSCKSTSPLVLSLYAAVIVYLNNM